MKDFTLKDWSHVARPQTRRDVAPDYGRAIEKLYLACLWASPSEDVKRGFKELLQEVSGNETSYALRIMAGRLHDGLSYGNWPRA